LTIEIGYNGGVLLIEGRRARQFFVRA
jgi:hypothetical protein